MSRLIVVYGAQWGSEGKGQVCAAIVEQDISDGVLCAVRVGGPNAGHTVTDAQGTVRKLQQIPVAAFVRPDTISHIGCSGLVLPDVLERELGWLEALWGTWNDPPLLIDHGAVVILPEHMEREAGLKKSISSTGEGVGAATADKVMRRAKTFEQWLDEDKSRLAGCRHLFEFRDTVRMLNWGTGKDWATVMLEGTQGYLLSLNTSGFYPFTTSRECGPDALCSQVGISPRAFDQVNIIAVARTFPIRVGGPSGPLPHEISWEELREQTGGYVSEPERTTVTNKIRRIAELDPEMLTDALWETRPTSLAMSFLDYKFPKEAGKKTEAELSGEAIDWLEEMVEMLGIPISWVSTGAGQRYTFPYHSSF